MKKLFIAGNWKMNKTITESIQLTRDILSKTKNLSNTKIIIAPPFTSLSEVSRLLGNSEVSLSAQNCHYETFGAFTGEISPIMLKEIGCRYVIVGHSERRHIFGETDEIINKKIQAVLKFDMIPIFCIGETLEERHDGLTFNTIEQQIRIGLKGLQKPDIEKIVIAYEPVWAIGTGVRATIEQISEVHSFIRVFLQKTYVGNSEKPLILYGGSVNGANCAEIFSLPNVDGALVGGASLSSDEFVSIIKQSEEISAK
ncbi:MAG: triose-phosphate isomerase [Candidatus Kapaibacteriales bacterium]